MTNERYKIFKALDMATERRLGYGLLFILSPSDHGKSSIRDMFRRDNPKFKLMPSGTETAIYDFLVTAADEGARNICLDDMTEWDRDAFNKGISFLKILGTGKIKRLKMNFKTKEDGERPAYMNGILMLNADQANNCFQRLKETGFEARALKIKVAHKVDEYKRIRNLFRAHGWSDQNLPYYKVEDDFFKPENEMGNIDPDIAKWIDDNFQTGAFKPVNMIASVVSRRGFESLKPCLLSGIKNQDFNEVVEFDLSKCNCVKCRNNGHDKTEPLLAGGVNN